MCRRDVDFAGIRLQISRLPPTLSWGSRSRKRVFTKPPVGIVVVLAGIVTTAVQAESATETFPAFAGVVFPAVAAVTFPAVGAAVAPGVAVVAVSGKAAEAVTMNAAVALAALVVVSDNAAEAATLAAAPALAAGCTGSQCGAQKGRHSQTKKNHVLVPPQVRRYEIERADSCRARSMVGLLVQHCLYGNS